MVYEYNSCNIFCSDLELTYREFCWAWHEQHLILCLLNLPEPRLGIGYEDRSLDLSDSLLMIQFGLNQPCMSELDHQNNSHNVYWFLSLINKQVKFAMLEDDTPSQVEGEGSFQLFRTATFLKHNRLIILTFHVIQLTSIGILSLLKLFSQKVFKQGQFRPTNF